MQADMFFKEKMGERVRGFHRGRKGGEILSTCKTMGVGNGIMETVPAKNKQHCYILKLPAKWLLEKRSVYTPIS